MGRGEGWLTSLLSTKATNKKQAGKLQDANSILESCQADKITGWQVDKNTWLRASFFRFQTIDPKYVKKLPGLSKRAVLDNY